MNRMKIPLVCLAALLLATLSGCALLPGSARAIENRAANNLRQVAIAAQVYKIDHGTFPQTTDQLRPYLIGAADILADVEIVPSPDAAKATNSALIVIARSTNKLPSGRTAVAYADGHVVLE